MFISVYILCYLYIYCAIDFNTMNLSFLSNLKKLPVLKEAYRYLNRYIAASLKLLTSGIAVIFPKGGLPLFSLTNQETRFTWLKLGCKGQGPLLTCKHQVKKKH